MDTLNIINRVREKLQVVMKKIAGFREIIQCATAASKKSREAPASAHIKTINLPTDRPAPALPSCFSVVYTSKDGKYCLYETKDGNLISADTEKFV